ncbi:MAG: DUF362 domain-containing protein [Acidobacteriota bacterium]
MPSMLDDARVALVKDSPHYAQSPPFHPSERLPEWPDMIISQEDNPAYRAIRELLRNLNLDSAHFGTQDWNPLGEIIQPGNIVVLKPNLVSHRNHGPETDTDSLVTHGSVIRTVLDYTAKALQGCGKIIIGDCPIQGSNWQKLCTLIGLNEIEKYFRTNFSNIELIIKDYRLGRAIMNGEQVCERIVDIESISHYLEIDLKEHSLLLPLMQDSHEFGVSQYQRRRMRAAHTLQTNQYLMPKDLLYANVIINLPKMKSHMKAGITGAMKNFVGINGHKDYLPHFRFGSPKQGGDEYPDGNLLWDLMWFCHHCDWELDRGRLKRLFNLAGRTCAKILRLYGYPKGFDSIGGGSWYGNDTLWRTVIDINRAFFYFDRKNQRLTDQLSPDVKYLAILDGLVGGQKEGPLSPTPITSAVMLAAFNPLALDSVAAALMGFDIIKIKQIWEAFSLTTLPLANFPVTEIEILSDLPQRSISDIYQEKAYIPFQPSQGFLGQVEYLG